MKFTTPVHGIGCFLRQKKLLGELDEHCAVSYIYACIRIYVDRVIGRNFHHIHSCRDVVSGVDTSQGPRQTGQVHQPLQADEYRYSVLRR